MANWFNFERCLRIFAASLAINATLISSLMAAQPMPQNRAANVNGNAPQHFITIGTPRNKVDVWLGPQQAGWTILCLGRSMATYEGGTRVIFFHDRVISLSAESLAPVSPEPGAPLRIGEGTVLVDPSVVCGAAVPGPQGELKRDVEECYFFAPPSPRMIPPEVGPVMPPEACPIPRHRLRLY